VGYDAEDEDAVAGQGVLAAEREDRRVRPPAAAAVCSRAAFIAMRSRSGLIGFSTTAAMPLARYFFASSGSALAVRATIGTAAAAPSRARIAFVAWTPSM